MNTIEDRSLDPLDSFFSVEEFDEVYKDVNSFGAAHNNGPYRDLKTESFWDFVDTGIEKLLKDDQFHV